ncbi:alpha/beta fold hydrolase [Nibrella saemangeumensis]
MNILFQTEALLKKVIAEETKLPLSSLNRDETFETYGIESVMIVEITQKLERYFGPLSKTLFFEYRSINELAEYFAEHHAGDLQKIFDAREIPAPQPPPIVAPEASGATGLVEAPQPPLVKAVEVPRPAPGAAATQEQKEVAIIGISGRFPKAANMREFWRNLKNGRDCISEIPGELWDLEEFFDPIRGKDGKSYSKWGGFMDDIDKFDPLFFKMSNLEAESIDPQERLFLQTVYHTLNDAGYTSENLQGYRVGVYVGIMWSQYQLYGVEKANAGSSYASVANRVSYFFNFNGPSIGLDTMCSSSLTAVHLACESLVSGETDVAIAGGVNITVHPNKFLFLTKTGFASSDGRCRSFGAGGDGYVPGDGVGALLLKPLARAISDGDYIYGIIKSTSINHGGKTNGYTVPNPRAQSSLIAEGLRKANIDPATISYFETHGTGTALGDPIELRGLTTAFAGTSEVQFCSIGSVKSNIGHLESAAGFAGIAKVLLQMRHRQIAPSLHAETLNPNLDFSNTPFFVQQQLAPWKAPVLERDGERIIVPLRAGISSFGAGGANGFVLLEEFTAARTVPVPKDGEFLIPLSAPSKERLKACAQELHEFLEWELGSAKGETEKPALLENMVTREVLAATSEMLNVNEVLLDADDHFQDYDLNENHYKLLAEKLDQTFGITIPTSTLISFDTPLRLSRYIVQELSGGHAAYTAIDRIAYTLQTGREHMQERLAIIAASSAGLLEQLRTFLRDEKAGGIFTGNIATLKDENVRDDGFVNNLLEGRKLQKLADIWCRGINIDWKNLYNGIKPVKIPLPGYAFAKERCWVSDPTNFSYTKRRQLHPLVHSVDTLATLSMGLTYQTSFAVTDRLIRDHISNGIAVLNAGTILATLLAAATVTKQGIIKLESVQLDDHSISNADLSLRTKVSAQGESFILELSTNNKAIAGAQASYNNKGESAQMAIKEIQGRYDQFAARDYFYNELLQRGTAYGSYFKIFRNVAFSASGAMGHYLLSTAPVSEPYCHPAILQGIFQLIGFASDGSETCRYVTNLFMDEIPGQEGYVQVTKNSDSSWSAIVMNEKGRVSLRAEGIATAGNELDALDRFFYKPVWKRLEITSEDLLTPGSRIKRNILIVYPQEAGKLKEQLMELLYYCNFYEILLGQETQVISEKSWELGVDHTESIAGCLKHISNLQEVYFLGGIQEQKEDADAGYLERMQKQGIIALMHLVKGLFEKMKDDAIVLKVVTNNLYSISEDERPYPYSACVAGFAKTIEKEFPKINTQLVDIDLFAGSAETVVLESIAVARHGLKEWALRKGSHYQRKLLPAPIAPAQQTAFRTKGVYLMAGGSGNVGYKLSCYLAGHYQAHIIWTGRSAMNEGIREKEEQLAKLGGKLSYFQVDLKDIAGFTRCVDEITRNIGQINGIFHSAMAFDFTRISQLTKESLSEMLKAKVQGSMTLLLAFRKHPLDFMTFFSSGEAFVGNTGWSAYAAACNFKDTIAQYMRQLVPFPVHVINWGFWEGNSRGNEAILREKGIYPITAKQGMEVVERVAASSITQTLALNVDDAVLQLMGVELPSANRPFPKNEDKPAPQKMGVAETAPPAAKPAAAAALPEASYQLVCDYLVSVLSKVLKIDSSNIDIEADLANYGVDSLIVINIHKAMEETLGTLPATLMLNFPTISEIAGYLLEQHKEAVQSTLLPDAFATVNDGEEQPGNEEVQMIWPVTDGEEDDAARGVFEVVRVIPASEAGDFLENYGRQFREGTLNNASDRKLYNIFPWHLVHGNLVQLMVTTSNGKKVEVILSGKGSPILFIPPVALTAPVWYNQFMSMTNKHCVTVIHAPGYGLSETIRENNTKGVAEVYAEVIGLLYPGQPVHLIASCFGTIAAQYLASHNADQVASLTLVGGFYDNIGIPDIDPEKLAIDELFALVQKVSGSLKADFDNVLAHLPDTEEEAKRRNQVQRFADLLLNSQCANPLVAMKYLNELLTLFTLPWMPMIEVPTLCIYGNYDTVVDPKASRVLHEGIAHSRLIEIKGAGHYPFLTHDDQFNDLLNAFLDEQKASMQHIPNSPTKIKA